MQKNIINKKIKLILTIGICVMFILLVFSGTAKKPDKSFEAFPVVRFIGSTQQKGNLTGIFDTDWVDVPGVIFNFTLHTEIDVDIRGFGSSYSSGNIGLRYVIDNIPYGDSAYGELLIFEDSIGYHPWYLERIVTLSPGEHSVKLQIKSMGSSHIYWYDNECWGARLFIQIW